MNKKEIRKLIKRALKEDIGKGDITSETILPLNLNTRAFIISKEKGIICGLEIAEMVFKSVEKKIIFKKLVKEGEEVEVKEKVAEIIGPARKILSAERTALNFLQRLSGIATLTYEFIKKTKPYKVEILDTRKTTPGLRSLEKYAVRIGGGKNHRFGLWDRILIKENHIDLVGLRFAIRKAKKFGKKVEVEVRNLKEIKEALEEGADIIMLDNMKLKEMKKGVKLIKKRALIEVSGNVTLKRIKEIARLGVNWISIGELTHSPKCLDLSLKIERWQGKQEVRKV